MDLSQAISTLRSGGIIAHATDTCYGFACDIMNARALEKLYALKKMPAEKPVSILVSDLDMAKKYGDFNEMALELAKKYWPGALTIIVRRQATLPDFLNRGHATVGIRVPAHELSLELARKLDGPISTTSANITTLPSPYSIAEISRQFENEQLKPNYIIDSGTLPQNPPSTIVDVSECRVKIIRQGSVRVDN